VDAPRARGRCAEARRPRGLREHVPRPALGRDAAARRPRARVRGRPEGDALRRAVQRARSAHPPRHARRGRPPAARDGEDDGVNHARPARGAAARRSDRDHARRQDRPARDARGSRRLAGGRLRAELHPRHPAQPRADAAVDHARPRVGRARRAEAHRRQDRAARRAADRGQRSSGVLRRGRPRRRHRRPHRRARRDRRRGRLMMATATDYAAPVAAIPAHRPWWRGRAGLVVLIVLAILIGFLGWKNARPWPDSLVWNSLVSYLDRFQNWLSDSRNAAHPSSVFSVFNDFANFLDNLVSWLTSFFDKLTWVGTTALGTLVVARYGHWRQALGVLFAFASFAAMGLWDESVQTFALMLAAVGLSLLVGVPLGVLAGRSRRFMNFMTPLLDAMQIVPAFAYLMPVVILFSVGPGAAVVTTMIYAVPPAIRITALGIRGVAPNTVQAAAPLGSARLQPIAKVQHPLAGRMAVLAV